MDIDAWADLGDGSLGIWSRTAALRALTASALEGRLARGEWQVVWPGVYADGGYVLSHEQQAVAAVIASGDDVGKERSHIRAVACGRTAARVHGLPLIDDEDPSTEAHEHLLDDVHTFRARSGRSRVLTHRERSLTRHRLTLLDGDVVQHTSGLWLTSALRTACDCARLLSFEAAVALVDAALHRELFDTDALAAAVRDREGWPGVRRLAAVATAADGRAESPAETVARLLLLPVLPGLVPQVKVRDRAGRVVARLDLGDEDIRFAVEVDGKRGHAGTQMVAKDRRRDRRTDSYGWRVERISWHDSRARPAATRAWITEAADRHVKRSF